MTSDELNALMDEHRLNVKKIAAMLHVSIGCVYKWKTGQRKISAMASAMLKERLAPQREKVLRSGDLWGGR